MRMRQPKSKLNETYLSAIVVIIGVFLFYGLPPVLAQVFDGHSVQKTELKNGYRPELAVVNLPVGEKFVSHGPIIEGIQPYITEKRPAGEKPRRLTIFRPSMTTARSWEIYIYIQEH